MLIGQRKVSRLISRREVSTLGLWVLGSGGGGGPAAPSQPEILSATPSGDAVTLAVSIDDTIGEDDIFQTQITSIADTLWATPEIDTTDTITAGEDTANEVDQGLTGLTAGDKKVRVRVATAAAPTNWSEWSDDETFTIASSTTYYTTYLSHAQY